MHVRLHPAHNHGVRGRAEASEIQRARAPEQHGCLGSKRRGESDVKLDQLTQALAQAVVVKVKQSFNVSVSAAPRHAGLNPIEQAGGEIANAVGTALHTPGEDGSVPDATEVRAIAQSAIEESARELQQVGAASSALTDAVDALTAHLGSLFGALGSAPSSAEDSIAAAATSARLVTKEKGMLELRTVEGDIVRIRFGTRVDVRAQGFVASDGFGSASAFDVTAKVRSIAEFSVKGDLNDEELAAIADLVGQVDALANEFFAGNVDKAFAAAATLDLEGGPVADLALRLSMTQRYSESNVAARQPLPSGASAPAAAAPAAPAELPPAAPAPEAAASIPESPPAETPDVPESAAPADASAADSIQLVMAKFLARSWMTFQDNDTARLGVSMKMKFQLLVAAVDAATPTDAQSDKAGVAKLAEVANGVAKNTV